jgi:hypothetical protein
METVRIERLIEHVPAAFYLTCPKCGLRRKLGQSPQYSAIRTYAGDATCGSCGTEFVRVDDYTFEVRTPAQRLNNRSKAIKAAREVAEAHYGPSGISERELERWAEIVLRHIQG